MSKIDLNALRLNLDQIKDIVTAPMSFEANLKTATRIYFPYRIKINRLRAIATKAIAATDNGTVQGANSTGDSTGGLLTFTASAAIDTEATAVTPTTNNYVEAGSYYKLTSAKATSGGSCLVTIEYEKA